MMLRLVTGANSNSAPDVTANLLVPWQRKVIFELCCCASADCIKASNRTTHINLIDDRPSLLCQMLSSPVDIIAAENSSAKSALGQKQRLAHQLGDVRLPSDSRHGNVSRGVQPMALRGRL